MWVSQIAHMFAMGILEGDQKFGQSLCTLLLSSTPRCGPLHGRLLATPYPLKSLACREGGIVGIVPPDDRSIRPVGR